VLWRGEGIHQIHQLSLKDHHQAIGHFDWKLSSFVKEIFDKMEYDKLKYMKAFEILYFMNLSVVQTRDAKGIIFIFNSR
jgi:hypothetical protein